MINNIFNIFELLQREVVSWFIFNLKAFVQQPTDLYF